MLTIRWIIVVSLILVGVTALAQDAAEDDALLTITIATERCNLVLVDDSAEAEATAEAEVTPEAEITPEPEVTPDPDAEPMSDYPVITLGDECDTVIPLLRVPNNGTLWLALAMPDEDDWQQFAVLENDDFPPALDRRGRFIGCAIRAQGEQTCRVLWTYDDVTYLVEIPVIVGDAFIAPTTVPATAVPTEADNPPPPPPPAPPPPATTQEP